MTATTIAVVPNDKAIKTKIKGERLENFNNLLTLWSVGTKIFVISNTMEC